MTERILVWGLFIAGILAALFIAVTSFVRPAFGHDFYPIKLLLRSELPADP